MTTIPETERKGPAVTNDEERKGPAVTNDEETIRGAADCRVLSIQSHVVSGYVGNKSATFPLQVKYVLFI